MLGIDVKNSLKRAVISLEFLVHLLLISFLEISEVLIVLLLIALFINCQVCLD